MLNDVIITAARLSIKIIRTYFLPFPFRVPSRMNSKTVPTWFPYRESFNDSIKDFDFVRRFVFSRPNLLAYR